jgi:hypothetical protein
MGCGTCTTKHLHNGANGNANVLSLLSLRNLARLSLFILKGRTFVLVPKILDIHDLVWNLEDFEIWSVI